MQSYPQLINHLGPPRFQIYALEKKMIQLFCMTRGFPAIKFLDIRTEKSIPGSMCLIFFKTIKKMKEKHVFFSTNALSLEILKY